MSAWIHAPRLERLLSFLFIGAFLCLSSTAARAEEKAARLKMTVDTSEAPAMAAWAAESKKRCEKAYPMISRHLASHDEPLPSEVHLVFKREQGIAATSGNLITCQEQWFKEHPDDYGAVIHELCHVVQAYHKPVPGWVTEGIADYVRWFCYEPADRRPRPDPKHAAYTDGYQTTAAFFDWIMRTKDKTFIRRLNTTARDGKYSDDLFREYAGKPLDQLWAEYLKTLKKAG